MSRRATVAYVIRHGQERGKGTYLSAHSSGVMGGFWDDDQLFALRWRFGEPLSAKANAAIYGGRVVRLVSRDAKAARRALRVAEALNADLTKEVEELRANQLCVHCGAAYQDHSPTCAAKQLKELTAERDAYLDNLTATQKRCTELLMEVRSLRARASLPSVLREQVQDFHRYVSLQTDPTTPTIPTDARVRLRAALIAEEFYETMEAMFKNDYDYWRATKSEAKQWIEAGTPKVDLPELADGLADLDYVVEGTRLEFGIDGGPIAAEVHAANWRKKDGPVSPTGKILKPKDWVGPDIARELRAQGWKGGAT